MSRPPGLSSISGIEDDSDEVFIPWESLDICVRGSPLLKFGRQGEPHFRDFQLSQDCKYLAWASQKKTDGDSRVILRGCKLFEGQQTDVFRRQNRGDLEGLCFSLMYDDPQRRGQLRSLDVACKDRREYDAWVTALSFLCTSSPPQGLLRARQSSLWVDVTPIGSSNGKGGIGAKSNSRITKDLKKRIKDTNDIYSWGRSSWGELGLGDEVTHPRPTLVNMLLGKAVKNVACGSAHCIAVCEEGETYAWGHGGCGRLGTGSVDHELTPRLLLRPSGTDRGYLSSSKSFQRNENTPFRFRTIACGDMHSLGVGLEDGHVYTWGAGSSGALGSTRRSNQLYPTLIPGCVSFIQLTEGSTTSDLNSNPVIQSRSSMASFVNFLPPRLVLVKPHVVAVGAGNSYSSFVDNLGRIFTCGNMESPLGHDVAHLSRIMQAIKHSNAAVVSVAAASAVAGGPSSSSSPGGGISQVSPARQPVISMTSTGTNSSIGSESSHLTGSSLGKKTGMSLAAMAAAVAAAAEANAISIAASAAGLESIPKSILMREVKASPRPQESGQELTLQSEVIADSLASVVEGCLESFAGGGATTAASDLLVPVQVLVGGLSGSGAAVQTLALSCGDMHMCVVTSGGHAYSWGWGGSGALGHGDTLDRTIPSRISSLPRDVVEVACGAAHTLVLVDRLLPLPPPPSMPPPTTSATSAPERESSGSFSAASVPSTPTTTTSIGSTQIVANELQIHRDCVRELYAFGSSAFGQVPAPRGVSTETASMAASTSSRAGARPGTICVLPRLVDMPMVSKSKEQAALKKGVQSGGKEDEDVVALRAIPRSIAAGAFHSAFISTENVLYVCGTGSRGELGISASAAAALAQSVVPVSSALSPSGGNEKRSTSSVVSPAGDLLRASSGFSGIALRIKSLKIVPWENVRLHSEGSSDGSSSSISAESLSTSQNTATARRSSFAAGDDLGGKSGALMSPRSIGSPVGFSVDGDYTGPHPSSSVEESKTDLNKVGFGDLRPRSLILGHIYPSLGVHQSSKDASVLLGRQSTQNDNGFDSDDDDDDVDKEVQEKTKQDRGSSLPGRHSPTHSLSKADARRLQQEKELDTRRSASPTCVPEYTNEAYMRTSLPGTNQLSSPEALSPNSGAASHSGMASHHSSTAAVAVVAAAITARNVFSRTRTQASISGGNNSTSVTTKFSPFSDSSFLTSTSLSITSAVSRRSDAILDSTLSYGFLPVPGLMSKEVRSVSCGNGFTVASVATEWMSNDAALICMRCARPFTTFFRKHHCRLCGGVFCTECSSSKTPLLKLGYIEPVRVCDGCFARV